MKRCICVYTVRTLHRTHQFYLTIEQALLCGDPLLVEGVTTPLDPALQPLFEMLHSWNYNGTYPHVVFLLFHMHLVH